MQILIKKNKLDRNIPLWTRVVVKRQTSIDARRFLQGVHGVYEAVSVDYEGHLSGCLVDSSSLKEALAGAKV